MRGYRGIDGVFTYNPRNGYSDQPLSLPCGRCIACRINHSYEWGMRGYHEASLHDENIFCTLTYDDDNLPYRANLHRPDIQDFFKRLRHSQPQKIRNLYSGEYGDVTNRPHFHACIFNYRPDDQELVSEKGDQKFYTSEKLNALWGLGYVSFSDVNVTSTAYTMAYTTKKKYGPLAKDEYECTDPETGEIYQLTPPFSGSSTRPGIGIPWLQKYLNDTYRNDCVIINGRKLRPCKAYDVFVQRNHESLWRTIRARRKKHHPVPTLQTNPERVDYFNPKTDSSYNRSDQRRLACESLLAARQTQRKEQ